MEIQQLINETFAMWAQGAVPTTIVTVEIDGGTERYGTAGLVVDDLSAGTVKLVAYTEQPPA